jgi:hypothetical protein
MKLRLQICLIIILMTVVLLIPNNAPAVSETVYPFDYELEFPSNQNMATLGYFDLNNLTKDQTQNLSIILKNNLNQPLTIDILSQDCYTNPQGDLLYTKNPETSDIDFTDTRFKWSDKIVPSDNQIILKARESRRLSVKITVPDIEYGEVIGAINFSYESKNYNNNLQTTDNRNASFNIKLRNAITVAIKANLNTPPAIADPVMILRDAGFNTNTGMAYIGIENNLESLNYDVSGDFKIINQSNQIVSEGDIKILKMAPKTYVRYPVMLNSKAIEPGKYTLTANMKSHGKTISKTMNIIVSNNDIQTYESIAHPPAVAKNQGLLSNQVFILTLLGVLLLIIIVLIIIIFKVYKKGNK